MHQSKLCGMLGICKKAGRMITGTDMVVESIRSARKSLVLVLLSENASKNTEKKVGNCCTHYGIKRQVLPIDSETLARVVGKTGAISTIGILDAGFADAIIKLLAEQSENKEQREDNV